MDTQVIPVEQFERNPSTTHQVATRAIRTTSHTFDATPYFAKLQYTLHATGQGKTVAFIQYGQASNRTEDV